MNRIEQRVKVHQDALEAWEGTGHNQSALPLCTPEERWEKPTTVVVTKPGASRALKVYRGPTAKSEAEDACKPGYVVEVRPGSSIRCERFCHVKQWCSQYAAMPKSDEAE